MSKLILIFAIVLIVSAMKIQSEGDNSPQSCIQEKCPTQWAACLKDPKCPPALDDCNKKCGTKASCWALCLPSKGSQPAIDVAKCAQKEGCDKAAEEIQVQIAVASPRQCIEDHCKNQLATCRKDSKCLPALQDCEKQCQKDAACFNTCLAKKNNPNANALWACIVKNDCMNKVQAQTMAVALADPQKCIQEKCPTQWAACLKDPKCPPALDDCNKKCGTKASCWALCLPSKGSQPAIDVAKCAQKEGCDKAAEEIQVQIAVASPRQCIEDHCKNQLATCRKDSKCLPALQDCEKQCQKDAACFNTCLAKKNNPNANALWACIVKNDCMNKVQAQTMAVALADPQQCLKDKCPNQWAACLKDPKCPPALDDCNKKCGTKQSCWELCLPGKGSQPAIDAAKCALANGCLGSNIQQTAVAIATIDPQECIKKYCDDVQAACINDKKCIQTLDFCDKQCNTTKTCWTDCLTKAKNDNASKYIKCLYDHKCINASSSTTSSIATLQDPQQCIQEKCPNQWAACQKDSKCVPALQDCQKKCGSKQTCWEFCLPGKGSQAAIDVAKCAAANKCI